MNVYKAIAAVQAQMAKEGISKGRKNLQQGYQFRGIDDLYNALAPVLSANGLVILPRMVARESVERTSAKGGALFYVTVEAEFDFVAAEDGSKHTVRTFGEAMDSADKATNKAMSAAYKYAAMQAFCIPTEGDNDADSTTHEVAPMVGLPPPVLKRHVEAIAKADSMDSLKTAYTAGYKAAHAVRDTVAEEVLAEAKDNRKTELEGVAA